MCMYYMYSVLMCAYYYYLDYYFNFLCTHTLPTQCYLTVNPGTIRYRFYLQSPKLKTSCQSKKNAPQMLNDFRKFSLIINIILYSAVSSI